MKGIKFSLLAFVGAAALSAAFPVMAVMSVPMGWYLEGNLGATKLTSANFGPATSSSSSGLGWNVNGGFKFMPYFATEIGFTRYAKSSIRSNGVGVAQDTNYSYDVAGKGILPVSDSGFEFFAKLGLARLMSHVTITNSNYVSANGVSVNSGSRAVTGAYLGVGADYSFMPNLAVAAQWQRAKGNSSTGNSDLYSLGVNYTF